MPPHGSHTKMAASGGSPATPPSQASDLDTCSESACGDTPSPKKARVETPTSTSSTSNATPSPKEMVNEERLKQDLAIDRAMRLRDIVMEAMLANDARRLCGLQKEMQRLEVNEHVLKYTGIGYVVSDNMAWPPKCRAVMKDVKDKWLKKVRGGRMDAVMGRMAVMVCIPAQDIKPFAGTTLIPFVEKAAAMASVLREEDTVQGELGIYKAAGLVLAAKGFNSVKELKSFRPAEAPLFTRQVAVVAVLERCFTKWQVQREVENEARRRVLQTQKDMPPPPSCLPTCDGEQVAKQIEENAIGEGLKQHKELSEQLHFPCTDSMPHPSQMTKDIVKALRTTRAEQRSGLRRDACI